MSERSIASGLREEITHLDLRFTVMRVLSKALPALVGNRLRTALIRAGGLSIGRGTTIGGPLQVLGTGRAVRRVFIGSDCVLNTSCLFDASAQISVGDRVGIGQEVMLLTSTHEMSDPRRRIGALRPLPIDIRDGAWLGARCVILPGVTVGAGAVVAAGAVVSKDVPPDTLVAGVPARVVRALSAQDRVAAKS